MYIKIIIEKPNNSKDIKVNYMAFLSCKNQITVTIIDNSMRMNFI